VSITTNVASSNSVHDEVYSIVHHVIKFVSDLRQVGGFLRSTPVSSTNKTDEPEILLKVALNIVTLTLTYVIKRSSKIQYTDRQDITEI
jgi:hypothetical protein